MGPDQQWDGILKKSIQRLIQEELETGMTPWWFITFHYRDGKTKEDEITRDIHHIKNRINRYAYKKRDRTIKGKGRFINPKMIFFNETSRR